MAGTNPNPTLPVKFVRVPAYFPVKKFLPPAVSWPAPAQAVTNATTASINLKTFRVIMK